MSEGRKELGAPVVVSLLRTPCPMPRNDARKAVGIVYTVASIMAYTVSIIIENARMAAVTDLIP